METMKAKISVTVEKKFVDWVDEQVETMRFRNRSHAVEYALAKFIEREQEKEQLLTSVHAVNVFSRGFQCSAVKTFVRHEVIDP